jgi:iron complex outermembrane receptor protein
VAPHSKVGMSFYPQNYAIADGLAFLYNHDSQEAIFEGDQMDTRTNGGATVALRKLSSGTAAGNNNEGVTANESHSSSTAHARVLAAALACLACAVTTHANGAGADDAGPAEATWLQLGGGITAGVDSSQQLSAEQPRDKQPHSEQLEEVTVTARRREELLQDVPISVTALSGEQLQQNGIHSIMDVQDLVPSLTVTTNSPGSGTQSLSFGIRGQRANETLLLNDPAVGTYFADVVQPRPWGFGGALYDIDSVQVLKGVQGTLFGRNIIGGAVLIEPKVPTQDLDTQFTVSAGNYNLRDIYAMANLPINEWAAVRVAGDFRLRDGFVRQDGTNEDYYNQDTDSFRISLLLHPLDGVENTMMFDSILADDNGAPLVPTGINFGNFPAGCPSPGTVAGTQECLGRAGVIDPFPPALQNTLSQLGSSNITVDSRVGDGSRFDAFDRPPFSDLRNDGITNKTTIALGAGAVVKNIIGYRKIDYDRLTDYFPGGVSFFPAEDTTDIKQYSEELQFQGSSLADRLNYTLGAFYFDEKGSDFATISEVPELQLLAAPPSYTAESLLLRIGGIGDAKSSAVYTAETYKLTDQWSLAAGVRESFERRSATVSPAKPNIDQCEYDLNLTGNPAGEVPYSKCSFSNSKSWSAFTYDFTVQYKPAQSVTTYISTRRGFRSGGFNLQAQDPIQFRPFNPETVQEEELGLKTTSNLTVGQLTTSMAGYYQDYTNVQQLIGVVTPTVVSNTVANVAAKKIYGGELEVALALANGLTTRAYASYVNAVITKLGDPSLIGTFALQGVPHAETGLSFNYVSYNVPAQLGELSISGNVSYRSLIHLDTINPAADQHGYSLVNLRMGLNKLRGTKLGLFLFCNNLTNRQYFTDAFVHLSDLGINSEILGDPRVYGLELSYGL